MPTNTPDTAASDSLTGDTTLVLPEFDDPPSEPLLLLQRWLDGAQLHKVREPSAAVLATASATVSTRVVSVKEADEAGLIFTSFATSRKGRDLQAHPFASLSLYWRETLQQINIAGPVEQVSDVESDRLFAERPRPAQATTAVSDQSQPLQDEQALREHAKRLLENTAPVARPAQWKGYRLQPLTIEFWYGSPDRLHRRLRYDRPDVDTAWTHQRLQP